MGEVEYVTRLRKASLNEYQITLVSIQRRGHHFWQIAFYVDVIISRGCMYYLEKSNRGTVADKLYLSVIIDHTLKSNEMLRQSPIT